MTATGSSRSWAARTASRWRQTLSNPDLPEPTALDLASVVRQRGVVLRHDRGGGGRLHPGLHPPRLLRLGQSRPRQLQRHRRGPRAARRAQRNLAGPGRHPARHRAHTTAAPSATLAAATENQAEVNTSFLSVAPSQGQGLFTQLTTNESRRREPVETAPEAPVGQAPAAPPWIRSVLGAG